MTQHRSDSVMKKDKQLRHELYALLQEGLNKNGDSNHSHLNQELVIDTNDLIERVGLYY